MSSLQKSFGHFKDTMLYGKESISLDDVQSTLNSKELNQRSDSKMQGNAEGLYSRGRSEKKDGSKSQKGKSRSKSRSNGKKNIRCYY